MIVSSALRQVLIFNMSWKTNGWWGFVFFSKYETEVEGSKKSSNKRLIGIIHDINTGTAGLNTGGNMHCGSFVYRQVMRNDQGWHQCGHKKYCPTQTVPNFGWCTLGLFPPLHNSTTQQSAVHCDVYSQPVPSNFPTYRDETGRKDEAFFGLVGMLASEAMLASVAIKRLMDVRCCVQQVHGAWHPLTDTGPFM